MSFIRWMFERRTRMMMIELPTPIASALETYTFMQNNARAEDDQLRPDDIVTLALAEHLRKNLWTNVVDNFEVVTKISRHEESYDSRSLPPSNRQRKNS